MKVWTVRPTNMVGEIEFGTNRTEIRKILGDNYSEFKKSKFSKNTTDDYKDFHVFYDVNNNFEAIEFFENVEVTVDGKKIYPSKVEDLLASFEGFKNDGYGYINKTLSIGFTSVDDNIESILFGKKNYYN